MAVFAAETLCGEPRSAVWLLTGGACGRAGAGALCACSMTAGTSSDLRSSGSMAITAAASVMISASTGGVSSGLDVDSCDVVSPVVTTLSSQPSLSASGVLRRFVGDTPWAHLDIAGPSFNSGGPWGHVTSGGTGVAVATLVAYAESQA